MGRALKRGGRLLLLATLALVGGFVVMAHWADRLIFVPPPGSYDRGLPGLVLMPTTTGDTVAGLFAEEPGAPVAVLFLHGNAEDIGDGRNMAPAYGRLGVTFLAVDYPGYGLSAGVPSEPGAYAAADAALRFLDRQGYPAGRVVVHGRSLGGAVAVDLASRHAVAGLVIESSFLSAFRVMLPLPGLPGDRFVSVDKLPRVKAPTLLIHGTRDEVVDFSHGQRLYAALPDEQRRSYWVEGAGHNDLLLVAGAAYWRELSGFLASLPAWSGPTG